MKVKYVLFCLVWHKTTTLVPFVYIELVTKN